MYIKLFHDLRIQKFFRNTDGVLQPSICCKSILSCSFSSISVLSALCTSSEQTYVTKAGKSLTIDFIISLKWGTTSPHSSWTCSCTKDISSVCLASWLFSVHAAAASFMSSVIPAAQLNWGWFCNNSTFKLRLDTSACWILWMLMAVDTSVSWNSSTKLTGHGSTLHSTQRSLCAEKTSGQLPPCSEFFSTSRVSLTVPLPHSLLQPVASGVQALNSQSTGQSCSLQRFVVVRPKFGQRPPFSAGCSTSNVLEHKPPPQDAEQGLKSDQIPEQFFGKPLTQVSSLKSWWHFMAGKPSCCHMSRYAFLPNSSTTWPLKWARHESRAPSKQKRDRARGKRFFNVSTCAPSMVRGSTDTQTLRAVVATTALSPKARMAPQRTKNFLDFDGCHWLELVVSPGSSQEESEFTSGSPDSCVTSEIKDASIFSGKGKLGAGGLPWTASSPASWTIDHGVSFSVFGVASAHPPMINPTGY